VKTAAAAGLGIGEIITAGASWRRRSRSAVDRGKRQFRQRRSRPVRFEVTSHHTRADPDDRQATTPRARFPRPARETSTPEPAQRLMREVPNSTREPAPTLKTLPREKS
jgi:hypothetical protein